jgi:hypothetical protein
VFYKKLRPIIQRGQTCKLIAASAVQHYLYETGSHTSQPLPIYKDHHHSESLRQRAKREIGSQAGEVYGPAQISSVLNYDGFTTHNFRINDENKYQQFIREFLDQGQPVIVYFDVSVQIRNLRQMGIPNAYGGQHEHAAAACGYYYDAANTMQLIYSQWGDFFTASVHDIFVSSQQLPTDKLPEYYEKYSVPFFRPKAEWINPLQLAHRLDEVYGSDTVMRSLTDAYVNSCRFIFSKKPLRISNPPSGLQGSLACVLSMIEGNNQSLTISDDYQVYKCKDEIQAEASIPRNSA